MFFFFLNKIFLDFFPNRELLLDHQNSCIDLYKSYSVDNFLRIPNLTVIFSRILLKFCWALFKRFVQYFMRRFHHIFSTNSWKIHHAVRNFFQKYFINYFRKSQINLSRIFIVGKFSLDSPD